MVIEKCVKESFVVIGKEGSTVDGAGFIEMLWKDATKNFMEIENLVKKDDNGNIGGFWGAMSDFTHSFKPWDNFSQGLYLAGAECVNGAEPPEGWSKWVIPSYEYIYVENENNHTFADVIQYLQDKSITLVGAAHDFNCPQTGKGYIFFPVREVSN